MLSAHFLGKAIVIKGILDVINYALLAFFLFSILKVEKAKPSTLTKDDLKALEADLNVPEFPHTPKNGGSYNYNESFTNSGSDNLQMALIMKDVKVTGSEEKRSTFFNRYREGEFYIFEED